MVRETRHLWVGNLPDDIREEKLVEHFARYGRVESAKLTGKRDADGSQSAFVDFVDINSATKAHDASVITIGERDLQIEYNNPDSPTEIHPGESSREYELQGRIPRYENRRGGTVEDRYDPAGSTYEFDRSYGQHYGRENSQYRDESSSSPAYRERQRERTRANFYSHSRSSDQYENDPDYLKDSYGENFGDASLRKSRLKPFKTLPGQSKSPSARSGSGSGRKSKSNSRSRSRSRSKSTDSHSSDTGSEGWSRSRSRDRESDRESRNTETTQSSLGGSTKFSGLCVRNLPARSSDSSIKDGLFHEFKKYGQVTAVTVQGVGEDRKGIVFFKRAEDMEKAMEASRGNSFFGCEMALSVWDGADLGVDDSEVKYFEKELDEFHPRATRTLFVGNLDRSVTREDLNEAFHKFGEIVHIEIKKPAGAQPFAFLQFSDIDSVVRARKKLDGEYVGKNKLGFGKSMATNCVWLDNLSQKVTEKYLMQFCGLRFGEVTRVVHDRRTNMALVFFINIDDSQKAVQDLKIGSIMGRRPKVDFASRECQNHFYDRMEQTGQAAYYNHSGETSPSCPTYPERNFKKSSGDYRGGYNSSTPFEPRRASRAQSSGGGFTKYSSGSYEDRYPYPSREEGYLDSRPYNKEYSSIRSSSYDGDDYQQELLEYGYHQKERTKEQYRDRSGSSSPSCRERSADGRQKSLSVEPADDVVSPVGSTEEGPVSRSPSPKRKWKGNSLMVQNSKEGSSTPMPRSPLSEEGLSEEPSWKNRNGNSGSERGSSLDQTDLLRKTKSKLSLDIPREEDLIERKKKVPPKLPVDRSSSPYLERPKGDPSLHGDSQLDRTRDPLEGDKDSWVDKFKDKKSPRSDFLLDKPALKRGLDVSETVSSVQHDLDSGKRWKDGESNADSVNDASSVGDQQKKLEARKQRFSDNSPVDIQKIRKERYFPPTSGKMPKLGKGNIRDSEYIPKGDSFLGDSRTVEDSHMSHKEGVPPDPSDNSNGGPPCKHNDRIDSFWWMPGQKLYSDDEKAEKSSEAAAEGTLQPQQPCSSETVADGGTTQAALNKPKKSIPDNSNLSQDRTRKRHKGRIPHISNDMDEGIASSSDQETPGSEEELGLKPLNSHSAHSNALQGSQGSDNLHASVKSTSVDTFEKPPQLDSKMTYRKQVENPRNKSFDAKQQARQRHPSFGEGQQVQEGKTKGMDEKGRLHTPKRKEQLGTVIQEMEWKMIPLDPITFPPSGRKEQIDAIYFGSGSDVNHPTEGSAEGTKLGLKTDSKAAGSLSSDLNNIESDQYCNPLSLNTVESENIRNDSDQLPLLSPKPGATKVGNTASPPTSAPPHLSPAVTPLKTREDIQADLAKANVTKLIGEQLHPKPNSVILENRNCQKTTFPDRDVKEKAFLSSSTLSSLNEKSSYLRPGEEKVNSWLRQIPSPTLPVTIDSTGESREQRPFLLMGGNNGSPSLSVTPSTPSTPSTPNDGRLGEVLSTKTRVERLSMCRIVKKNRNSVDVDRGNDKKAANDELIKYFQDRMQQNSIFSLDEARLNSDQSKLRVGVAPSISQSGSLLAKSKSEDVSPAESMKLNRSNSDPRMAAGSKLLSLPKSIDSTAAGMQQVSTLTSASLSSTLEKDQDAVTNETSSAKPDGGKEDSDIGRSGVDPALKRPTPTEVTKESLTSPSLPVTKEIPKLKSILKKRTDSLEDVEDVDDICSKEIEQGIKRKRSPSPVPGEAKKIHTASVDSSDKKTEDSTLSSAPKFPTNMLLLSPNERTKKLVVKPRSKPKTDKNAVLSVNTKKPVEKTVVVKKEVPAVRKEVNKGIGEMVKSKSVMREKSNLKSSGKKVEKKEERKVLAEKKADDKKGGEKKIEEKKHVEKKNVVERKEDKKSSEKQEVRKGEEKVSERKVEDVKVWKKEEKKVEKRDEKKTVMERKVDRRSDDKKQSEKKAEEKKSVKKSDEKKIVKDGKADDKRGSEKKVVEKKITEKKGEEKRGGEKKVEEKKIEKRGDEKKAIERKGDEKKVTEKKLEEKKVDKKEDRKVEERKVTETQKKSEKKVEKKVEEKRPEKKMEEKKSLDKKGDKKGSVPAVTEKRKPEKVSEKSKDTKLTEKSLPKKSEEKISETRPVEKEKIDKSKSKSNKKLQKADSADSKMKKPAVKEALKVRSKSEDKPKGKSPQVSPEKSSTPVKKVSKKVSGSSGTPVVSDGTGFGPGGFGGGVRALMDSYAESDSSESEDDEFEIFHQAASSGISKTQKAPALKKNVIFSSSDESDSETTERRNPNPVLQKLFDRESLSDSDFDEKPSSSLVMSSEAEEPPSRKQSPVKGKGKQIHEKSGRDKIEKEKPVETKKSKVEKEPKEVEKAVKRNEVIEPAEVKRGQDAKKISPKKTEVKAESRTKDKSGRSRSKKEVKDSKASKVEETEEMVEVPVTKSKAKKRETEMEKLHSRGKKMEVFDDSLSESFDEPIREQEEEIKTNITVEPEVKVQKGKPSKKSGKSRDKTKKGKNKPRHDPVEKQMVSKDEPGLDSWKDNIEEEVESKAEIEASTPLLEEEVKEPKPEPDPVPEIKPNDDGMDNDLDNTLENPPVQEYETEVVVEKVTKEEETPVVPVSIKVTKGKQKRKKGKHRQTKKGKKEPPPPSPPPPEEPAPVIPEITVSSESVEPVKQDKDRITEKESEIPETQDDEVVLKSEPSVSELPQGDETSEIMDECTDAEKAAAMFEETAEATAALELVEIDEQQRQRELAEEIFGEATPTAPSPSAPPTPSPTLPSPRPVSPRPSSPEIPEAAHADEVSSSSEVKIPEVVVSSIKEEEVEEDVEMAKVEKPSPSVNQEEMEQEQAKTEKEEAEIDLKDKICDEVKTEVELPKIELQSAVNVTAQEPAVKIEDEVRVKSEAPTVKSEEVLNEMKETSRAEVAGTVSLEAATVEIPLQGSCHANEPKSSLPESSVMSEVKVNSALPEVNVSENSGVKLEEVADVAPPLKPGDCSQELKSEDLEGAEETASVEVTTETASEANDSLVIAPEVLDMPAPFELPEKLPTTPTHKGKKKKKRKHRDKKNSKREGRKVDKEKKKKRKKSKSKEGKRKRQKTSHKSGRHRSLSSSSYHGDLQMEGRKNMERITEQATSASMEPVVNPSGLPIHKIENQQVFFSHDQHWHPGMDGMGNNFYRIPASMSGFPPGMPPMFNQSTAPIDSRFMKPPMVNSNLCPNEGNTSPLQTINADDMSLKIVGVNENIKLINFPAMKVDTPGQVQVAGMLSPSSSNDKTKKRHPSGKSGIVETLPLPHSGGSSKVEGQTLDQMQHMVSSGQAIMVKEEVEERDGTVMQNKSQPMTDSTMQSNVVGKDDTQEGYFEGASESENAKVNTKDFPQKAGDGAMEERSQEGDVYDFNEEEPSVAGRADHTRLGQSQKNASVDVYEFQESPGPSSTKASPSKMASAHRGKQKSRARGGGRTRSNSRGSAKDLKVKEEGQESGGVEETKKVESQVFPQKIEGEAEPLHKGAVAELVPSSDSKVVAKSEDPGSIHHPMPLSLPNSGGVLAGLLPIVAISQPEKQMMYAAADPHVRMMANVSAAQTTMATALQNKQGNGRMMPCHNSALAPSVSMPAVVAALNNNPANAKQHPPHMDIRNTVTQAPVMTTGSRKPSGRKRSDKKMAAQYQPQYTQQPHPQQIRNIPSTQSQVEAVELHFKESLMRNQRQNMVHKPASSLSTVQMPPGQPVAVIASQPGIIPAMITPTGTSSASASREAPAITSQLIGVGTHSYGNRSPAMAEGMKSGPHTVASVPESQTSPDTSIPGVTRSGMHPNLPSTLVSVPTPTPSKRQQGMINSKYECRVPTSVAATSYPDASVLRARLTQIEPKHRGNEEGKLLTAEGQVPGAFLHPSSFVEKPSGHGDEKVDPIKPGDRNVPTEQRLPAAYHPDGHMVYFNPRPDGHPVIRGPGPVIPGMFPDPTAAGLQGLPIPGLVHPGMDIPKGLPHHGNFSIPFGGPFPPRMFHPSLVHGDQNQPLASPRALASPRMVVPNTSSPRLSPKIKSPGLGHGDRTAQTPDKQAEHHNVVLRHPQAPGITTGIPPPGPEHPEVHNLPHRGLPHMMAQQPQMSKTERDLDKAPEDRRHHQGPPGQHGIPPHIQQLPAQNIPEHTRTTPGPHPERGSPGSHTPGARTPGPDGRPQQVILPNSSTMKQWPPPGISPHTPMAVRGSHPASPIPSMGGEASVMLYVRYPVMWQGMLALKQEIATIQLHYICGNKVVATDALKMAYPPLRIAQRMRLEDSQLDGVARRMQVSEESVVLLALPCGSDQDEILNQTSAMRAGLISYLKEKQAAGIINVGPPGCTDPSYVIHIFPPCEFTERSLSHKAPDLLESVMNVAYMMFVIATC